MILPTLSNSSRTDRLRPNVWGRVFCALFTTLCTLQVTYADDVSPENLDWQPASELSPQQRANMPTGCCGAYIDPLAKTATINTPTKEGAENTTKKNNNEELSISGDHSQITTNSTLVSGDVELLYGDSKLTGQQAELFNNPQSVHLSGDVSFREPGFLLRGESAEVDLENDTLDIKNSRYVLHDAHVHGEAEQIIRDDSGVIQLNRSTYSYCEPQDPLWQLRSQSMTLDTVKEQGEASHVRLEVLDIPVFYFPYLRFPIGDQRQSGFLTPSLSYGEEGLDIALPYYLNLAPNYDLTLIPRHISDRGTQLGGEFRHLSTLSESTLSAAWLSDDKQTDDDRWLIGLQQDAGKKQPWSVAIDATRVSDIDYFEDLDASGLSVNRSTHLRQQITAGYMSEHWDTQAEIKNYQILRDSTNTQDPYELLPNLSTQGFYALGNGFSTTLEHRYAQFEHDDAFEITGSRIGVDDGLIWNTQQQNFSLQSTVNIHHRSQYLDNTTNDDNPEVFIPSGSLDARLFFERDVTYNNQAYLQTFEPRIFYAYTDYENQDDFNLFDSDEMVFDYTQLYIPRQLSGTDRVADTDQTSLGFTTRWFNQNNNAESMNFSLGQIFYRGDRRVHGFEQADFNALPLKYRQRYTQARSPIVAQWQWFFHPQWRLNADISWRDADNKTEQSKVFLRYSGIDRKLFSIAYRHTELLTQNKPLVPINYQIETVRQGDVSSYWPLNNQWGLMGAARYDFTHHRSLETLAGVQYEDCCWRIRAAYRQWKENSDEVFNTELHEQNQGFFIEIQFKNLASTGNKINSLLEKNIVGYDAGE